MGTILDMSQNQNEISSCFSSQILCQKKIKLNLVPGEADALLLAARDVDSLLADLRLVPARQDVQVGAERARVDHLKFKG